MICVTNIFLESFFMWLEFFSPQNDSSNLGQKAWRLTKNLKYYVDAKLITVFAISNLLNRSYFAPA